MSLEQLKMRIPSYAKDIKLNLEAILSNTEAVNLKSIQITGMVLAAAYAAKQVDLIQNLEAYAREQGIDEAALCGIKAAASVMAMNNIYYRSTHLIQDTTYMKLPAKLRMNVIANPGIEKQDFELYCFVVSAVNGCGMCLDSHAKTLIASGFGQEEIQYSLRIAAIVHALAQVFVIENSSFLS